MDLKNFQTIHNLAVTDRLVAGDADIGSYTEIEPAGTLVAHGDARCWVDIDFPIIIRTTGTGVPTLTSLVGNLTAPQWNVNDYNICEGQEMIHGWVEGSTCYWHVHLITAAQDATDRYVKFEIEYAYATLYGTLTGAIIANSEELLIPANTTTRTHLIYPIANFTPDIKIGAQVYARLKRVTASGAAPSADPFVPTLQMHVLCDTIGSRKLGLK
jgi:hypothetical protein